MTDAEKKHSWNRANFGVRCLDCNAVPDSFVGRRHCTGEGIYPTENISRDASGLYGNSEDNLIALRYTNHNLVRIGPQGDGGPVAGGIVTGDPEDVRWFARKLLQLADEMEEIHSD